MRIISGKFRGRKLIKFNKEGIKPTTDKMRESVFNIVISYLKINEKKNNLPLENFNVLDIFAGTGALGLEAISRGAEKVTFIEKSRDNLRVLYKNIDHLKINENVKDSKEIEKIILCDVQNEIYPNLEKIFENLLNDSGYQSIKFKKKIDFEKLYNQRIN